GQTLGVLVEIPQDAVNGTVGQAVLLPVSYRVSSSSAFPVLFWWMFENSSHPIISCAVQNCSLDAEGAPKTCSANSFSKPAYSDRAELFPKNASLLLRHLQLSDSGVYTVTVQPPSKSRHIALTVHEQHVSPEHPGEGGGGTAVHIPCYSLGACYCVILLILQLLFHLLWLRGGHQQQGRSGQA
ncbi:HECAM protein, partial [Alectura lathami]|nr:HECAM protein [Alectura lathami]